MQLELTVEQAQELKTLLEQSLPELSHEIAATDNTVYRAGLNVYRDRLVEVTEALSRLLAAAPGAQLPPAELVRELAHPGD
ncbi:MAG TPA: hypothetical protein VK215_00170 [Acidimicrobiales bacterium]|jgi:hypothetical protein|nr:hypothetical protein [Acidimicrobiales bacterium]HLN40836.1 hypothetical protein [Acidimicrobiales bacterium]